MTINNNTPDIRFSGFSGDWVEEKLGDIANFSKGSGYSKADLRSSGHPIILYGSLYTKYQTVISEVDTFVNESKNSVKSQGNEVVVPASGETAEDIARASAVKQKGIILGGDLNVVGLSDAYNSVFTALKISNGQSKSELSKKAQGKSVVHIRNSDLQSLLLDFPNLEEQTTIGNFFQHIDETITLSRRKYEKTKTLKSIFFRKIFPKVGQTQPEMRFNGFDGDWNQKRLENMVEVITKGTSPIEKNRKGNINFIKIENIDKEFGHISNMQKISIEEHNGYLSRSKLLVDDILFSIAGSLGRVTTVKNEILPANTNQALAIIRLKKEADKNFIFYFLNSDSIQEHIKIIPTVGAQPNLSLGQVNDFSISLPKKLEQIAIGNFFKQLDDTLALQAKQLKALKNLKKSLLAKMFV